MIYIKVMMKNAATNPTKKPVTTCKRLCCLRIMRLDPTTPATNMTRQSHHVGSNWKSMANESNAPVTPPIAAVCVDTFHQTLISAQIIWIASADTRILLMK